MSEVKEFDIKWTMVVDLDKCTGCGACMVACQAENNVAPNPDGTNKVRSINWMKVYRLSNHKPFPEHDTAYLPRPCMQCGKPSCVSVCPVVATDKNEDGGIVSQIYPRCIGWLPVLHGLMPLPCPLFQLVRSDLAGRHGKNPHPGRFRASPRRGGKMHLLPSPLDEGQGQGHRRGTQPL